MLFDTETTLKYVSAIYKYMSHILVGYVFLLMHQIVIHTNTDLMKWMGYWPRHDDPN